MQKQKRSVCILLIVGIVGLLASGGYVRGSSAPISTSHGRSEVSTVHIEALMPEYHTEHEEAYLCTSVLLPDDPLKLVGVEPLSKQEVVHHMLLFGEFQATYKNTDFNPYSSCSLPSRWLLHTFVNTTISDGAGCAKPASSEKVWDCHTHSVCAEAGSHVLYGWAKNAEAMHLPPGVGFRVGQGTGTRHLVLQARIVPSRMY